LPSRYVDEHPVTIGVGQAAGEPRTPHPLTRQLGISLDDLVTPAASDPRVRRPSIHRNGMVIVPLAPEGAPSATYKITYPPVTSPPELRVHDGYEWLYVLSGRLRLL